MSSIGEVRSQIKKLQKVLKTSSGKEKKLCYKQLHLKNEELKRIRNNVK